MEVLLEKERKARMEGSNEELQKIFSDMLVLCRSDDEILGLVRILAIKRGQSRAAIKWMIRDLFSRKQSEAGFVDFFNAILRDVIEGKIFLEEERIYISEELRRRHEAHGDVESALETVINVPVETFTVIREGVIINYQLEQLRLCIANLDWVRADITLKKIRKRYFEGEGTMEEKVKFYEMTVLLYLGQRKYFDASEIYHILSQVDSNSVVRVVLSSFFCILTTCETEMSCVSKRKREMLQKLSEDKNNDEAMRAIVKRFLSSLVLDKSILGDIQASLSPLTDISPYLADLTAAVDEHNFRVIERFYSSIALQDMAMIMQISTEEAVRRISFMVNNRFAQCKINQKTEMVGFGERRRYEDVGNVLDKLIKCNHLVHKERLGASLRRTD